MKLLLRLRYLFMIAFLCCTQTYASDLNILVQRNCDNGDLKLRAGETSVHTGCVWKPNESEGMQVTLHLSKKVDFVVGSCIFQPAANASPDKVIDVRTSKSGRSNGAAAPLGILSGYFIITGNQIKFVARNFNTFVSDTDEYPSQMNIAFYLANNRYTPGDRIECEFSPI